MSLKERVSRLLRAPEKTGQEEAGEAPGEARQTSGPVPAIVVELAKLVREMLVIPAQLWLALAEVAGSIVLAAWRRIARPLLALALALVGLLYRLALRHVTPARAVAVVALVAIGVLAASQWVDYRGVSVGNDAYAGSTGLVAPAPEVARERAGEAHSWVMVPLAAAALIVLGLALGGRRRLARLLIPIGLAVIAISLLVDVSSGLDEGTAAISYEGVEAHLLEGFWLQIVAAVAIIAAGLLLPGHLEPGRAAAREPRARSRSRRTRDRQTLPIGEAQT